MKKAWKIISAVLVWCVVLVAVAMMVFTIFSVNTFDRNDRAVFGHKMYIVLSDSMSATDFDAGDLVIVREVDASTLQAGDIISFTSQNAENPGEVMTHKIRSLTTTPNGEPGFITYGTTTDTNDEAIVTYPYVLGQYKGRIARLGYFFNFLKTTQGYLVCIFIPFMLLILYQGLNTIRLFKQYKKEQSEALEEEKRRLEEERKENERVLAELRELKAKLEKTEGSEDSEK